MHRVRKILFRNHIVGSPSSWVNTLFTEAHMRKNCEHDIVGFTPVLVVVDPTIAVAIVGCATAEDPPIIASVAADVVVDAGPANSAANAVTDVAVVAGTADAVANVGANVAVDEAVVPVSAAIVEPLVDSPSSQSESLVGIFGGRSWIDLFSKIIEEGGTSHSRRVVRHIASFGDSGDDEDESQGKAKEVTPKKCKKKKNKKQKIVRNTETTKPEKKKKKLKL
ncbi:hypothetical protein GIB67_042157 [Kingdonia uniflora]|uniref:Uncharacterized protein n=1 Tax=Kingdonia uniflora TaxID=39325 RepID=A0A7J7NXD0_9MAGN|nr:hypothetical protein GIB67_042157 [Kingdonia uniflora]